MHPVHLLNDIINPALREAEAASGGRIKPSDPARQMLLAIAMQESGSDLEARYQMNGGPARGLWQFERIAVKDVMTRATSIDVAQKVLKDRGLPWTAAGASEVHEALATDDRLAAIFARLNLWNDPQALPQAHQRQDAFGTYLRVWRPGAYANGTVQQRDALRAKWDKNWRRAEMTLDAEGPMP